MSESAKPRPNETLRVLFVLGYVDALKWKSHRKRTKPLFAFPHHCIRNPFGKWAKRICFFILPIYEWELWMFAVISAPPLCVCAACTMCHFTCTLRMQNAKNIIKLDRGINASHWHSHICEWTSIVFYLHTQTISITSSTMHSHSHPRPPTARAHTHEATQIYFIDRHLCIKTTCSSIILPDCVKPMCTVSLAHRPIACHGCHDIQCGNGITVSGKWQQQTMYVIAILFTIQWNENGFEAAWEMKERAGKSGWVNQKPFSVFCFISYM